MFVSGCLLSVFSMITGKFVPVSEIPIHAWLSIGYLVVIGSVIAFGAYIYALKRLPTALVAVHSYINPIVAIILGNILMEEKLTAFIVGGTMITLWGVYLVNNSFKKPKA
jgi:drug/metabolite transporter (DMT)-like permease